MRTYRAQLYTVHASRGGNERVGLLNFPWHLVGLFFLPLCDRETSATSFSQGCRVSTREMMRSREMERTSVVITAIGLWSNYHTAHAWCWLSRLGRRILQSAEFDLYGGHSSIAAKSYLMQKFCRHVATNCWFPSALRTHDTASCGQSDLPVLP